MLISMDHDCTPYCPICISDEDLLKSVTTRNIVAKPMSYKPALKAAVRLVCIVFAIATVLLYCLPNGQVHKSHEATGGLIGHQSSIGLAEKLQVIEYLSKDIRQSSTGLAERLKVIEFLSKDVRFSLTESANIMAAKNAGFSASDYPNSGPSLSPDNHNSAPPASASDRKKKPESGFALLDKSLKAVLLSLALGFQATVLTIALLLIQKQVTTRSFINGQFLIGSADKLELSEPRWTDVTSSQIIEAAQILLELSIESAERREVSESRRTDVPSSQLESAAQILLMLLIESDERLQVSQPRQTDVPSSPTEAAHIKVAQEVGTSATDCAHQTDLSVFLWPSPSPDNHDSPPDEWEFIEPEEA